MEETEQILRNFGLIVGVRLLSLLTCPSALNEYLVGGLIVMAVFVFVARPLTVLACLIPDRRGRWTRNEIVFLSWCRETGVIPAALAALLLAEDVPGADIAVSMVALAVCVTLLLQDTTSRSPRPPPRPGRRKPGFFATRRART